MSPYPRLHRFAIALIVSVFLAQVCGCEDVGAPAPPTAQVKTELAPFGRTAPGGFGIRDGELRAEAYTCAELIGELWQIPPHELVTDAPLPDDRLNWQITVADPDPADRRAPFRAALNDHLNHAYALAVRSEQRDIPVVYLKMDGNEPEGFAPTPADADGSPQVGISGASGGGLTLRCRRRPLAELLPFLAEAIGRPVIDQTGLDLSKPWDVKLNGVPTAWPADREKLTLGETNLILVAGRAEHPVVVVTKTTMPAP